VSHCSFVSLGTENAQYSRSSQIPSFCQRGAQTWHPSQAAPALRNTLRWQLRRVSAGLLAKPFSYRLVIFCPQESGVLRLASRVLAGHHLLPRDSRSRNRSENVGDYSSSQNRQPSLLTNSPASNACRQCFWSLTCRKDVTVRQLHLSAPSLCRMA
jgi:hypothetical protein